MAAPLHRADLVNLRHSMAAAGSLPPDQVHRVLDELDRLLTEREQLVAVLDELRTGPWLDLRQQLGDLERTLARDR